MPDDSDLQRQSFRSLGFFLVAVAAVIFLPAWSLTFWQGWLYLLVFAAATVAITLFFLRRDPELVRRRMKAGAAAETEPEQKAIQGATGALFVATYGVSGLDHLLGWSHMPAGVSVAADVVAALGFAGVFATLRANTFAGSTIVVTSGQRVIDSGPYAIVRHPMYATAALLILATPIALGSWWGLLPALLVMAGIVARLLAEERFLVFNLPGYAPYVRRTRYRLVPGLW